MSFMISMIALFPLDLDIIYLKQAYRNLAANYLHLYYEGIHLRFIYLLYFVVGFDDKEFGTLPTDTPVSFGFLMAVDYAFFFVEPSQSVYSRILRLF